MTTYGLTPQGFVLKPLSAIRQDVLVALATVSDPSTGETLLVDLYDENDPLAQLANAVCDSLAEAWEQLQQVNNQWDPLQAIGSGLSGLVLLNGITRLPGSSSTVPCTLTGTPNAYVPAGQQIATVDRQTVFVLPAFTFDGSGNASGVIATSLTEGTIAAAIHTLVIILTPGGDIITVTNSADATLGTYEETDTQLRLRQQMSTETTSQATVEGLYGALVNISGVTYARVYQNMTLTTDSRGITAKSVAAVVLGGDEDAIAQAIFHQVRCGCVVDG